MAETVMDFKHAYHMWLTRLDDVETATYKSAFDAGVDAATAALAQKDEEIDRLTKERDDAQSMTRLVSRANDTYAGIEHELTTLRAQLEQYKKDTDRYRWLRDKANTHMRVGPQVCISDCLGDMCRFLDGAEVDKSIDAAMGKNDTEQK